MFHLPLALIAAQSRSAPEKPPVKRYLIDALCGFCSDLSASIVHPASLVFVLVMRYSPLTLDEMYFTFVFRQNVVAGAAHKH